MTSPVRLELVEDIGVLVIDSPPVNALSSDVVQGISVGIEQFEAARNLRALVICCAGRTFVAGGDLRTFDDPDFDSRPYNRTLARIEAMDRPVVAALHGTALGGGLELALACHYRVAVTGTKLGFPEILVGVLPGSLGTQRLPRLVPVTVALEMMLGGRTIDADRALSLGLLDRIATQIDARDAGLRYARALLATGEGPRPTAGRSVQSAGVEADFFAKKLREVDQAQRAYPAARAIVECVQAATRMTFDDGERIEAKHFDACRRSSASHAMRHLFFAEREAVRIPGLPRDLPRRTIRKIGVVGAGTMGCGIAMNFANIGLPTILVEANSALLDRGLETIRKNYAVSVAKGKIAESEMQVRMDCLKGALNGEELADCDLVIEAVFEDMALKRDLMSRLGKTCKAGAVLATNTSTLDVDRIAEASGRPSDVIGTHFFSPANIMRLLEVVRGRQTAPDVLVTVMELARRIGKTAVVSGVCYGFIGNRMAEPYMRENEFLLMEGATPGQIDGAVEDVASIGMAMGPCRMLDMAGIDVGAKTLIELGKTGGLPDDPSYRAVCLKLYADGRFGQKTGTGYYRYEGRSPLPEPATIAACEDLAKIHGMRRRSEIGNEEIVERLILPLINEAAKILQEGIALRPGDIDVVWRAGYGFPDYRGGPLWMADEIGLPQVVGRLEHYANVRGNPFGYWTPSPLLEELAASRRRISDWIGARVQDQR
jgi:3-hydroxyacyl-CoA dehydrogenase